jgi:hypothetical protein
MVASPCLSEVGSQEAIHDKDTVLRFPSSDIRLYFEVEDTGPGIAPDEVDTIFDPFIQKRTDKTPSEGTGLGLAISRKFVQMIGGDIAVRSDLGKGTVFSFDIPVDPADRGEIGIEKPARRIIGLEPDQPAYGILVVEDNLENRALRCRLLRSVGFIEFVEAVKQLGVFWAVLNEQPHGGSTHEQ